MTRAICTFTLTVADTSRRYVGGHYSTLLRGIRGATSRTSMQARLVPGVTRGFFKRYTWRMFEPTQNTYDFSELTADVAWAASNDILMIPLIEDKTFVNEFPNPDYMLPWTMPNTAGGYSMARWDDYYQERYQALLTAVGLAFDNNPNFGGIGAQETALSVDNTRLFSPAVDKSYAPYSVTAYKNACISLITHAATAIPKSRLFFHANFIPTVFDGVPIFTEIIEATKNLGVMVFGGPDVLPPPSNLIDRFYPLFETYKNQIPLMIHSQPDSYSHFKADGVTYYTMSEMFAYARDTLNVNYMIWTYIPNPTEVGAYRYDDAIPVMQANPTFNVEPW